MKKVEELAKECISEQDERWQGLFSEIAERYFIRGYNKAKEWISVDDELQESEHLVIVKQIIKGEEYILLSNYHLSRKEFGCECYDMEYDIFLTGII